MMWQKYSNVKKCRKRDISRKNLHASTDLSEYEIFVLLFKKTHFHSQLLFKGFIFILNFTFILAGKNQHSFNFIFM